MSLFGVNLWYEVADAATALDFLAVISELNHVGGWASVVPMVKWHSPKIVSSSGFAVLPSFTLPIGVECLFSFSSHELLFRV